MSKMTLELITFSQPVVLRDLYVIALAVAETSKGPVPIAVFPPVSPILPPPPEAKRDDADAPTRPEPVEVSEIKIGAVLFDGDVGDDPGDWLIVRGHVMASDRGAVAAGARLDETVHAFANTPLAESLRVEDEGERRAGITDHLITDALSTAVNLLKRGGDRDLGSFRVSVSRESPELVVSADGMLGKDSLRFGVDASQTTKGAPAPPAGDKPTSTSGASAGASETPPSTAPSTSIEKPSPSSNPGDQPITGAAAQGGPAVAAKAKTPAPAGA